jgi:hypothetical protein
LRAAGPTHFQLITAVLVRAVIVGFPQPARKLLQQSVVTDSRLALLARARAFRVNSLHGNSDLVLAVLSILLPRQPPTVELQGDHFARDIAAPGPPSMSNVTRVV